MAHPVVFIYLSYSTTLAEHAVHCFRWCPAFGQAGTCLFLSVKIVADIDYQLCSLLGLGFSFLSRNVVIFIKKKGNKVFFWEMETRPLLNWDEGKKTVFVLVHLLTDLV